MSFVTQDNFLVFLCLACIYGTLTFFSVLRLTKVQQFSSDWAQTKVFYASVFLQSLLRTVSFVIFMLEADLLDNKAVFLTVSLPDSLFIVDYALLTWLMFLVFFHAHEDTYARLEKPLESQQPWTMLSFAAIWATVQTGLYTAYTLDYVTAEDISKELGLANIVLPTTCMLLMLYLHLRHSGVLMISNMWKAKSLRISLVTLMWSVTRIARGSVNILEEYSQTDLNASFASASEEDRVTAFWIGVLLVSEVACMFMVLDYAFVGIFLFAEGEEPRRVDHAEVEVPHAMVSSNPFVDEADLAILGTISSRKGELGVVYKAQCGEKQVTYRKIEFPRISKYVVEEFLEEIESYQYFSASRVAPIVGIVQNLPTVGILTPFYTTSLYEAIHIRGSEMPHSVAIQICCQLADTLAEVHQQGRYHGHLTSHNVMLSATNEPILADLGFHKVKKYAGIVLGYTMKSGWSPPAVLSQNRLIPAKGDPADDVYSLGIILWEMLTRQEPFVGYSLAELRENVVDKGLRPKVPEDLSMKLTTVILACWQADSVKRPTMTELVSSLKAVPI